MSTTLTFGRKLPDDGDKGSTFFDDLEANIALDDAHTHDGANSSTIATSALNNTTASILSANWVAVAGKAGLYSQVITMPTGLTLGNRGIVFIDSTTGDFYTLSVEQETTTTYTVYINDNTIDLTAIYL